MLLMWCLFCLCCRIGAYDCGGSDLSYDYFCELVPKRIGLSVSEAAKLMARPMNVLAMIASPFVWLLSKSTELIFNLLGIKGDDGKVTEEEIKSIIKEGSGRRGCRTRGTEHHAARFHVGKDLEDRFYHDA